MSDERDRLIDGLPEWLRNTITRPDPGRYILNAAGEPEPCPDLLTWGAWMERANRDRSRIIAQDYDEGDPAHIVKVSTVFLGLDHAFGTTPPILWETMIFGGVLDGFQDRYTSRAAAIRGHQAACERVTATIHRPPPAAEPEP